jgi:ribosome-associated protein
VGAPADPSSAARPPAPVAVQLPITLGQFIKAAGLVGTGGEAKYLVVSGQVSVNGEEETRRGRHLAFGDTVAISTGDSALVTQDADHG